MRTMRSGLLNNLLVFEQRTVTTSTSSTGIGAPVEAWSTWGRAWAQVITKGGKEQFTEARETAVSRLTFRIRYTPDISPLTNDGSGGVDSPGEYRLIYPYSTDNSGPRWDIENVQDEEGRKHTILIHAMRRQ